MNVLDEKLDFLASFMEIKSVNPRLRQDQIAKELGCSTITLQRYRNDINMLSTFRFPPNNTSKRRQNISTTNLDDNSHRERDAKRPCLTWFDLKKPQSTSKESSPETVEPKKKQIERRWKYRN